VSATNTTNGEKKMTYTERQELVSVCREFENKNVLRTSEESTALRAKAFAAASKLGFEFPEDVLEYYGEI